MTLGGKKTVNKADTIEAAERASGSLKRMVRCAAWMSLAWGMVGGWEILAEWWPQLNRVTKDQVTVIVALAVICGQKK